MSFYTLQQLSVCLNECMAFILPWRYDRILNLRYNDHLSPPMDSRNHF